PPDASSSQHQYLGSLREDLNGRKLTSTQNKA
ncbi:MAG: hypothetical protein ACI8RN_001304, partial [Glaciecola sp.]